MKELFIRNKNGVNGGRYFLAVDHERNVLVTGTTNATSVSYTSIDDKTKLPTIKAIKAKKEQLLNRGYTEGNWEN